MMIVFANSKGGVGKSSLAVHAAVWLHDRGYRVGLLDGDKQCSSSIWIAEAEPEIRVLRADSPESCLQATRKLLSDCDVVVGDGPAGLDEISRSLLLLADIAVCPLTPSILDYRSLAESTNILRYAQQLNGGRPESILVLNRTKKRDRISAELRAAAPQLGLAIASQNIRDLQAYRDAAQQGTVVTRMGRSAASAAVEIDQLFQFIFSEWISKNLHNKEVHNA